MTTTTADTSLHPCECGCGELVKGRFKRGHYLKATRGNLAPLPGPDEDLDSDPEPIEFADPDEFPAELADEIDALERQNAEPPPEVPPVGPPGRLSEDRGKRRPGPAASKGPRVTAAVRKDVHAKIRIVLVPVGRTWAMRDPVCGGTFCEQEPDISDALAEIVCDSPDLLGWFTGPAGGFMKYFKLLMALQPVALAVWMHHMVHAEMAVDGTQPPQMPAFAA